MNVVWSPKTEDETRVEMGEKVMQYSYSSQFCIQHGKNV